MALTEAEKIGIGIGAAAAAGLGGWVIYRHYAIRTTNPPNEPSSVNFGFGQPYLSSVRVRKGGGLFGAAALYASPPTSIVSGVGGLVKMNPLSGQVGQHLHVPLIVGNNSSSQTLYFSAAGFTYEESGQTNTTLPGIGSIDIAGHLDNGNGGSITFSVAHGSSTANLSTPPTLVSAGPLTEATYPIGVYVWATVFTDSAMSKQIGTVAAWTNAFLSLTYNLAQLISFGFGTPSVSLARVV